MGSQTCIVFGNVGQIQDLKIVGEDKVVNFSVAVSRGQDRPTTWFNCAAWNNLADVVTQYVKVGMSVQVTGQVSARGYIANDGTAKASLQLNARDIQLPSRSSSAAGEEYDDHYDAPPADDHTNDIPF